ncbi:hypothetical protein [Streptosporangium sp. CA-115845]|uniref:hypothetical protein n=1 Tax=Streptosporangium sp. CA-115845 TaxID=3240071 RepID=UPI003D947282
MALTKVELFGQTRRDSWHEGLGIRAPARKYGVREALTRPEPTPRETPQRRAVMPAARDDEQEVGP